MSWYDSDWKYRWPVVITGTLGTSDVTLTIPTDWSHFWDNVLATGYDIRLTDSDGITELTWQRLTWTHASKAGVLEIDNFSVTGSSYSDVIWLYWGYASASDDSGSFTASAPISAAVEFGRPSIFTYTLTPDAAGATTPTFELAKKTFESIHVWVDVTAMLEERIHSNEGSLKYEEIDTFTTQVLAAAIDQTALYDDTKQRVVEDVQGRVWVRLFLEAGTDDTDYTVVTSITTTKTRKFQFRILMKVRDPAEV